MSILDRMRESGNKLLESEEQSVSRWSKLRHTKEDLELLLQFNIAELRFRTEKGEPRSIICTSNSVLIKLLSLKDKEDKKKAAHLKATGISTRDRRSVDTWDLVEMKRKTVSLAAWSIENLLSITPENILVLDSLLAEITKK